MKATVTAVDQHKVSITIEIPAEDVKKGFAQAVKRIAGQVNIPGFRKGKAPRKILEMNYGKEAIAEEAFVLDTLKFPNAKMDANCKTRSSSVANLVFSTSRTWLDTSGAWITGRIFGAVSLLVILVCSSTFTGGRDPVFRYSPILETMAS